MDDPLYDTTTYANTTAIYTWYVLPVLVVSTCWDEFPAFVTEVKIEAYDGVHGKCVFAVGAVEKIEPDNTIPCVNMQCPFILRTCFI